MMKRRTALALLGGAAVTPAVSFAEVSAPKLHVGTANAQPRSAPQWVAFVRRMAELGYVEGRNFVFDHVQIAGPEVWEAGYREVVARKPDIVIATGPELSLRSAMVAAGRVPIVMIAIDYDPIALGFVANLGRPGGNVTGVHFQRIELTGKRLQLMKDAFPAMDSAIVFSDRQSGDQLVKAQAAASSLGLRLRPVTFAAPPYDYESAETNVPSGTRGFLFALGSPFFFRERARLAAFALKRNLISSFVAREFVVAGGLMSYGVSLAGMWELAATYVDKIARGAKAGDLPIQQPTKFELALNLKTAKALDVTFPADLLIRADEVIE